MHNAYDNVPSLYTQPLESPTFYLVWGKDVLYRKYKALSVEYPMCIQLQVLLCKWEGKVVAQYLTSVELWSAGGVAMFSLS